MARKQERTNSGPYLFRVRVYEFPFVSCSSTQLFDMHISVLYV